MPNPNDPNWGPSPLIGLRETMEEQNRRQQEALREVRIYNLRCAEAIGAMILHDLTVRRWKDVVYGEDGWNIFTMDGVFLACDGDLIDALKKANARIAARQAAELKRMGREKEDDQRTKHL